MREIKLTGKLGDGKYALVDDGDYEILSQHYWNVNISGYPIATIKQPSGKWRPVSMHKVLITDTPDGFEIDHINRNKLDNQRSNFRFATRSQNIANKPPSKANKSGYKGVTETRYGRWVATITTGGKYRKLRYIGTYSTKEEAALAYNAEATKMFGDFVYLNVIKDTK